MADIREDTHAIYALIGQYLPKSDTIELAIEFAQACKPVLSELKKECPWPFGNAYQVHCDQAIRTAYSIIEKQLVRFHWTITNNKTNLNDVNQFYDLRHEIASFQSKLVKIAEIINSYFLYPESKKELDQMMSYFLTKHSDLLHLYLAFYQKMMGTGLDNQ